MLLLDAFGDLTVPGSLPQEPLTIPHLMGVISSAALRGRSPHGRIMSPAQHKLWREIGKWLLDHPGHDFAGSEYHHDREAYRARQLYLRRRGRAMQRSIGSSPPSWW